MPQTKRWCFKEIIFLAKLAHELGYLQVTSVMNHSLGMNFQSEDKLIISNRMPGGPCSDSANMPLFLTHLTKFLCRFLSVARLLVMHHRPDIVGTFSVYCSCPVSRRLLIKNRILPQLAQFHQRLCLVYNVATPRPKVKEFVCGQTALSPSHFPPSLLLSTAYTSWIHGVNIR